MNFNRKEKIRNIALVVLSSLILWSAGILIFCRIFFVQRCPSEELKKALEFANSENSIGMSLDECKEIFPELSLHSNNQKASVYAGYFEYGNWDGQLEYTLYIFFDENDNVRFVQLRAIWVNELGMIEFDGGSSLQVGFSCYYREYVIYVTPTEDGKGVESAYYRCIYRRWV